MAIDEVSPGFSLHLWHPYYATMSGEPTPCLKEFLTLMQCVEQTKNAQANMASCRAAFDSLMRCLRTNGLTTVFPPD